MVAEPVTETAAPAEVAAPESQEDILPPPSGDTGESAGVDAVAGDTQDTGLSDEQIGAEYQAWKAAQSGDAEAQPAQETQVEERRGIDPELAQRASGLVKAKHAEGQKAIDAQREQLRKGEIDPGEFATNVKAIFNEFNSVVQQFGGAAAVFEERQSQVNAFWSGIKQALPAKQVEAFQADFEETAKANNGVVAWGEIFKLHEKQARVGYVPEKDVEKRERDAFVAGRKQAEKVGSAASSGQTVNGSAPQTPKGPPTVEEALTLPLDELDRRLAAS